MSPDRATVLAAPDAFPKACEYIAYTEQGENHGTMNPDGVCYPVIHFCRVILSRMVEPFCSQYFMILSWGVSCYMSTFISKCLQTSVSPLQCYQVRYNNKPFLTIFPRLSTLPSGEGVSTHKRTSNLGVEGCPNMPRNWSKAVPEGNGPVPQQKKNSGLVNLRWRMYIE